MRVLSTSESIKRNLAYVFINTINIYDENLLFNLFKTKSYGFRRCWIADSEHLKLDFRYRIDTSKPKISTREEMLIDLMIFLYLFKANI